MSNVGQCGLRRKGRNFDRGLGDNGTKAKVLRKNKYSATVYIATLVRDSLLSHVIVVVLSSIGP